MVKREMVTGNQTSPFQFNIYFAAYDAFVLYDIADSKFITKEFLPKIEGRSIRLFIPDRDLDVGRQHYSSQLEVMMDR